MGPKLGGGGVMKTSAISDDGCTTLMINFMASELYFNKAVIKKRIYVEKLKL